MQRVIKVRGRTGKFITPSFLYTDNDPLVIKFDVAEHRVGKYVAQVVCGEQKKTVYLGKDMSVEVLPDFIKAGEFNPIYVHLEFRTQYGDKVVIPNDPAKGGFFIEPLYIERVSGNTTFQAWATKIEEEVKALKDELSLVKAKLKEFEDEGVPLV
jgi:hypothetical protein